MYVSARACAHTQNTHFLSPSPFPKAGEKSVRCDKYVKRQTFSLYCDTSFIGTGWASLDVFLKFEVINAYYYLYTDIYTKNTYMSIFTNTYHCCSSFILAFLSESSQFARAFQQEVQRDTGNTIVFEFEHAALSLHLRCPIVPLLILLPFST